MSLLNLVKLLLAGGTMAGIAAITKPSKDSFTKYFDESLREQLNEKNSFPIFMNKLIAKGVKASSRISFRNYGVCRVAIVEIPHDEELYFLGALGNWFEIPDLEIINDLGIPIKDD